jgi:hypothetical protein
MVPHDAVCDLTEQVGRQVGRQVDKANDPRPAILRRVGHRKVVELLVVLFHHVGEPLVTAAGLERFARCRDEADGEAALEGRHQVRCRR